MSELPWYKTFYGADHLHMFEPLLSLQRTVQEVDGILKLLGLTSGSSILDLGCGHGRHAIVLAERGYHVVGQDLSEVFLERAQAEASAREVQVRWIHGDMREIPFEQEFDAVISISTAFGYFADEENLRVLTEVFKALKEGGVFLLDILHRDALVRGYLPFFVTRHDDGAMIVDERHFDLRTSRSEGRMTMFFPDGRRAEYHESVRIYTLTEIIGLLERAGFQLQAYYGGLHGAPLTFQTHRMVVIGRKATL